jgi:IS605 OrfB family transposase
VGDALAAGLTALAKQTMIADREIPECAVSADTWKRLEKEGVKTIPVDEPGTCSLQVWSYDPEVLVHKNHATSYAVEDLHIKGMVRNRKLAKSIQEVSWGKFLNFLDYKCIDAGKNVLVIGRFEPSSKTCNHCYHKMETMPLDVRVWDCPSCGIQSICRDTNAARNIRDMALADALGKSVYVKSSCTTNPVSAGVVSKGTELLAQYGSYEAPTRTASAV